MKTEIERAKESIKEYRKGYGQSQLPTDCIIQLMMGHAKSEQLLIHSVVSSFLDNLKYSDSQALLEMRERNQEEFIKWCAKNPYAGVDDEWDNDIMFMRDVAKYIEDLVV